MADKSRDLYRGILIPDGDITETWATYTNVDEAGNRAGIPSTFSKTEMILEASGHQEDNTEAQALSILSIRGGYPGPGEAGYAWTKTFEASEDYRGWDVPNVISSWENIDFSSTADFNLHPDLVNVTRNDGSDYMIAVYEFVSGTNSRVAMRKRDGDTWGSEVVIYAEAGYIAGKYKQPAILVLPSGRLLVFYWVYDHPNFLAQLQMAYSDDEGSNWTIGADYSLPTAINWLATGNPLRIRAAYKDGQILLLAWLWDLSTPQPDRILQYASDDFGATFTLVTEFSGADSSNSGALPDVTVSGGVFVVGWITGDGLRPSINRLGSAYEPINPLTPYVPEVVDPWAYFPFGGHITGEFSIATDRDGVVYLFGTQEPDVQGICVNLRSYDGGENWSPLGVGGGASTTYGRWWGANDPQSGDPDYQPIDYTVEFNRGRAVVIHRYLDTSEGAVGENSLCCFYLGGFSSVVMPGLELFKRDTRRVGFPVTWVPFTLPGNLNNWVQSVVGATTEQIISPGVLEIITPPTTRLHYQNTISEGTGNNDCRFEDGLIGRYTLEVKDAPSRAQINARLWTAGAGGVYGELRIFAYDNQIEVFDGVSLVTLATVPNAVDQKRQIFWAIRGILDGEGPTGVECAVWIRDWSTNDDRYWTLMYQGPLALAAGGANTFVQFGDRDIFTLGNTWWSEFNLCHGKQTVSPFFSFVGYQLAQGQANPDDLFPRNYSNVPLYVNGNVRIAAIDGPTFEADEWAINVRHLQGTENLLPTISPSPAKVWRSKTAANGQEITFLRNPDGEFAFPANFIYGIHFQNINFKRAEIEIKIGGSWILVGAVDFYREFDFQRSGHTLIPLSAANDGFYAYYNEFKDCKFEFFPDQENSQVATILRNSEGVAYGNPASKVSTIFLDPATFDHTTAPASGTGHLWFKNLTVNFDLGGFIVVFEAIRIRLCPTGTLPPEGYYEAGNIIPGPIAVFGYDYSRERNLTKTPNVQLSTLRDGTRHAYKAGEERRRVRFSWAEGVDVTQMREEYPVGTEPDDMKISPAGGVVALRQDAPLLMWGLENRTDGSALPIVYIPRIEFRNTVFQLQYDPRQHNRGAIYGRITSPITLETVVGTEETDEVYRVNTVTIEEEL